MKKFIFPFLLFIAVTRLTAQALIATSLSPEATANHNQRKIVRNASNIFVVYTDSLNHQAVIKGLSYSFVSQQWTGPAIVIPGHNPTLAITQGGKIHLFFESNDSLPVIRHISSADFNNWSPALTLSDALFGARLPVADCDSSGSVNVFWIQHHDSLSESLNYALLQDDSLLESKCAATKTLIKDIAIANHLQYFSNELFFAIQYDQDSLQFFVSGDHMSSCQPVYSARGAYPCISYNSWNGGWPYCPIKLLYINNSGQLIEVDSPMPGYASLDSHVLQAGPVTYVCIDDLAPNIGYSYLFMRNAKLYHGFSFGKLYGFSWWNTIMDTVSGNPFKPSLAYKYYNFAYVDFIWMTQNGSGYNIYYKRDPKNTQMGMTDTEPGKGFTITGYPNPFATRLNITVVVEQVKTLPLLQVFNFQGQLVKELPALAVSPNQYSYQWNGTNQGGDLVAQGTYVIVCTVAGKRTAKRIVFTGTR